VPPSFVIHPSAIRILQILFILSKKGLCSRAIVVAPSLRLAFFGAQRRHCMIAFSRFMV
jgi:hypothetical protein